MSRTTSKLIHASTEHIDNGERNQCGFCPVALAIKDVVKDRTLVTVDYKSIWIGDHRYNTPKLLAKRILLYDVTGKMTPHTFSLSIPKSLLRKEN